MLIHKRMEFETITPCYLGGASPKDPVNATEDTRIRLRPVLAMLRYWYRALLGGVVGTDPAGLKTIAKEEAKFFGGVDEKDGGASAIRPRLICDEAQIRRAAYTEDNQHRSYSTYLGY